MTQLQFTKLIEYVTIYEKLRKATVEKKDTVKPFRAELTGKLLFLIQSKKFFKPSYLFVFILIVLQKFQFVVFLWLRSFLYVKVIIPVL